MSETGRAIVIKFNNLGADAPCGICGDVVEPDVGPEMFLEGTWQLVCRECAETRAPEIVEFYDVLRSPHIRMIRGARS